MATYPGRIESKYTVPSGTTVSVSSGALTSAVAVTWPAADYFHASAGGVSSGLTALQTAINAAVSPYPSTAAAMSAAVGGTWTAGWLCQETSGNLTAAFGGVTLTAGSTPTYSNTGPGNGGDLAVGFNSTNDTFAGGDIYDLGATDDLVIAFVVKFDSVAAGFSDILGKGYGPGWYVTRGANTLYMYIHDGVDVVFPSVGVVAGVWYAVIGVLDRTTNQARLALCNIGGASGASAIASATAVGAVNNATPFAIGACGADLINGGHQIAAAYIGVGTGYAGSLVANLSTAAQSFADAIESAFSVSLDTATTGLVTCSNSFWPSSIQFTSTDARSLLGFDREFDYPATAAQMATVLGYGDWTSGAGYLCNESSGNLASVFGTPATLTATSLTYSNLGARGGSDKAIGFDNSADYADGGDVFDVASTGDIAIVWVGYVGSDPSSYNSVFSKWPATGISGWYLTYYPAQGIWWYGSNAAAGASFNSASSILPLKEQYVGIAVVDRSTGKARAGTIGLRSGTVNMSSEVTAAADAYSNATAFRVGAMATAGAETTATISAFYITTGSGVATGLSANLSTALSSFATSLKSQTGTQQAKGLWFPDSPLNCDDHPSMAPEETDVRMTESPTGNVLGLAGNRKYVHSNVRWQRVPVDRIREASATYANASLEVFFRDAVSGVGAHEWMGPASDLQVYWSNAGTDVLLGGDSTHAGWKPVGVYKFSDLARPSQEGWVGAFDVRFPRLVSDG